MSLFCSGIAVPAWQEQVDSIWYRVVVVTPDMVTVEMISPYHEWVELPPGVARERILVRALADIYADCTRRLKVKDATERARYCREGWESREQLFLNACEELRKRSDDERVGRVIRRVSTTFALDDGAHAEAATLQVVLDALYEIAKRWHWAQVTGDEKADELESKMRQLKAWEDGP